MDDFEARLKSLMLNGLDGDAIAHRQLLSLLSERLRAYFSQRMSSAQDDVEDLVQEALLAVHLRRASYDRAQPFTAWAYAIARYKLIDYWRRRKIRVTTPLEDVDDFLSAAPAQSDEGLDLTRALGTLPARQRSLIEDVESQGIKPQRGWRQGGRQRGRGQGGPASRAEGARREDAPCGRLS